MAESSTTAGNRLGGGQDDFQKTGANNWNFAAITEAESGLDKGSSSEYTDESEEDHPSRSKDKGKGKASSRIISESRSRSRSRDRPRTTTKKHKHGRKWKSKGKNGVTHPPLSKSRSGRSKDIEMIDLEANHRSGHRERQLQRGRRQNLGRRRRRKQKGTVFGISHFWWKVFATVVILATFFGGMAALIKKGGST